MDACCCYWMEWGGVKEGQRDVLEISVGAECNVCVYIDVYLYLSTCVRADAMRRSHDILRAVYLPSFEYQQSCCVCLAIMIDRAQSQCPCVRE